MQVPLWLASAGYLLALSFHRSKLALAVASAALLVHLWTLVVWLHRENGWDFGLLNALLLMSWLLAVETTATRWLRRPTGRFAELFWTLAALALLLRALFPDEGTALSELSFGMAVHIVASMLAFSLTTLAALLALWLNLLDWRLRHPKEGLRLGAAPPLEVLERIFFRLMTVGFFLLTLALGSGLLFVEDLLALPPKTFFSLLAWALFGALLYGRWRYGWRGRRASRLALSGFLALFLAYFVTKWVLEVLLR